MAGYPGYKAFRIKNESDVENMNLFRSRAKLIDAFSPEARGGTGKRIDPGLVKAAAVKNSLWLAGGLTPDNIGEILKKFRPELIDLSSGVEKSPGIKDHGKLETLFKEAASYE